jgi:hypothetical protein
MLLYIRMTNKGKSKAVKELEEKMMSGAASGKPLLSSLKPTKSNPITPYQNIKEMINESSDMISKKMTEDDMISMEKYFDAINEELKKWSKTHELGKLPDEFKVVQDKYERYIKEYNLKPAAPAPAEEEKKVEEVEPVDAIPEEPLDMKPDEADYADKRTYEKAVKEYEASITSTSSKGSPSDLRQVFNKNFLQKVDQVPELEKMKKQLELLDKNDTEIELILRNYLSRLLPEPETQKLMNDVSDPNQKFKQNLDIISKPNKDLTQGEDQSKVTYNGLIEGDNLKEFIKEAKHDMATMAKPKRMYVKTEARMRAIEQMRAKKFLNASQRRKDKLMELDEKIAKNKEILGLSVGETSGKSDATYDKMDPNSSSKVNMGETDKTTFGYNEAKADESMKKPYKSGEDALRGQLRQIEILGYLI